MEQLLGYFNFLLALLIIGGIYSVTTLGLNVNWGFTGLLNVGVVGFYGLGAYTAGILTTPVTDAHWGGLNLVEHLGYLGYIAGFIASMLIAGIVAFFVGKICLRLRSDYLAIATIGIAEIIRLFLKNEGDVTGGSIGMKDIPRPFGYLDEPWSSIVFLIIVFALVGMIYFFLERAYRSPWGRTLRAIRDNEDAAGAAGKDVAAWRLEGFVLGSAIMGLAGALTAHYARFFSPEDLRPENATFLVWVMLIVGGSGNNRGAILGAIIIWCIWSGIELISDIFAIPAEIATQIGYVKIFLIGLFLQIMLQFRPRGLLAEKPPIVKPSSG